MYAQGLCEGSVYEEKKRRGRCLFKTSQNGNPCLQVSDVVGGRLVPRPIANLDLYDIPNSLYTYLVVYVDGIPLHIYANRESA